MQNAQVTVLQENMQPAARRFLEDLPISVLSMQPSVTNPEKEIVLEPGEYVYLPGIRKAVEEGATKVTATVIGTDGSTRPMELELKNVTEAEKKVLLAGSLINFYKEEK